MIALIYTELSEISKFVEKQETWYTMLTFVIVLSDAYGQIDKNNDNVYIKRSDEHKFTDLSMPCPDSRHR